jgi:cell fate (sporulation/competence/biofilm development) regulator YlbF (YheA/YmcA/DUF963 family)
MYATLETLQLMTEAEEISKMIVTSEVADEYRRTHIALQQDREAQEVISRFVKMKEQYEEVQRFGKYHPDYKETRKKMSEIKRELQLNDKIAAFRKAEDDIQLLLDEVCWTIAQSVSPSIKVPSSNPFFATSGGCGGCSTGGTCGCRTK